MRPYPMIAWFAVVLLYLVAYHGVSRFTAPPAEAVVSPRRAAGYLQMPQASELLKAQAASIEAPLRAAARAAVGASTDTATASTSSSLLPPPPPLPKLELEGSLEAALKLAVLAGKPPGQVWTPLQQSLAIVHQSLSDDQPRILLRLFGWNVGAMHGEQCSAALAVSAASFLLTIVIYVASARCCCGARHQAHARRQTRQPDDDLWTVHNRRYDLRTFMHSHPGGIDALALGRGRNCTELVESYHSLADMQRVRRVLAAHYVEDAPPGAPDHEEHYEWNATPFFDELRCRVRAHFDSLPHGAHRADASQCAQLVFFVAASALALAGFMRGHAPCALLLPVCYWLGPSPCMHDGAHFSLSRRGWVNRICAYLGGAHMSHFCWSHQHTIGHHMHTNRAGLDPDLYHFSYSSLLPGFRTSPELQPQLHGQPHVSRAAWWRLGLALRAPLATVGPTLLWDIASLADPSLGFAFLGIVPLFRLSEAALASHSIGRSVVIWLAIIHPITICLVMADSWLAGLAWAIFFVMTPYALHGCIFYVFSQVSHVQQSCFPAAMAELARVSPNGDGGEGERASPRPLKQEWARHQVEHALDYASGSRFWLHLSNGLNLQVEHHLFPQVGWGHYRALAPIVRATCAEFGVTYAHQPTFWAALKAHHAHVQRLNSGELADEWARPQAALTHAERRWRHDPDRSNSHSRRRSGAAVAAK